MRGILIFASNTDCGKTLASAGLARAAALKGLSCTYVKPVQTGVAKESDTDAWKVKHWSGINDGRTLFQYKDAVSPHLAAQRENRIITSFEIRQKIAETLTNSQSKLNIVETAGGVLSPFPDEALASDALQLTSTKHGLRTILVGDARLGGISQTLAALEALERRQYDVCSLLLFATDKQEQSYGNEAYLRKRLVKNPPVRRINTPIPTEGDIPRSFFENPIFTQVLEDALNIDHDRRSM